MYTFKSWLYHFDFMTPNLSIVLLINHVKSWQTSLLCQNLLFQKCISYFFCFSWNHEVLFQIFLFFFFIFFTWVFGAKLLLDFFVSTLFLFVNSWKCLNHEHANRCHHKRLMYRIDLCYGYISRGSSLFLLFWKSIWCIYVLTASIS